MVAGTLSVMGVLLVVGKLTLVPLSHLLRLLAFCCVVLLLVPFRFTATRLGLEPFEWVLLNVLGIGPLIVSGALMLNWGLHGPTHCDTLRILRASHTDLFYRVELEDGRFAAFPSALEFASDPPGQLHARSLHICTARGLLGADVVTSRELLDH